MAGHGAGGSLYCEWSGGAGRQEVGAPVFGAFALCQRREGAQRGVEGHPCLGATQ